MKISAIKCYDNVNNHQCQQNKPSFGSVKISKTDLHKLIQEDELSEAGFKVLADTLKAKFNLRNIVDYEKRTAKEKTHFDNYVFKEIGEKEVNDPTILIERMPFPYDIGYLFRIIAPNFIDESAYEAVNYKYYAHRNKLGRYPDEKLGYYVPTPQNIIDYLRGILDYRVESSIRLEEFNAEKAAREAKNLAHFSNIKSLFD